MIRAISEVVAEMAGSLKAQPGRETHGRELAKNLIDLEIAAEDSVDGLVQECKQRISNIGKYNDCNDLEGQIT